MKRKDLVVGTVYAWTTSSAGRYAQPVTLVSADLHEMSQGRYGRPNGGITKAASHRTAAISGDEYPYIQVGVLVTHESGEQGLVNPAHIRGTWADWQAKQAIIAERVAETRERQHLADVEAANVRQKLTKLVADSPYAGRIKVGHDTRTMVDNTLLIEILVSAIAGAVEFGWEPGDE